jgi:hypothetical protein
MAETDRKVDDLDVAGQEDDINDDVCNRAT